jgi:hypothetical protein
VWKTTTRGGEGHTVETPGEEASEASPPPPTVTYSAETQSAPLAARANVQLSSAVSAHPSSAASANAQLAAGNSSNLAQAFSPLLWGDESDGFVPIGVEWALRLKDPANAFHVTVRCQDTNCSHHAAKLPLSWFSGQGERLHYPAENTPLSEELTTDNTINEYNKPGFKAWAYGKKRQYDETSNAQLSPNVNKVYYILLRRNHQLTIDYWYFYTFNYSNGWEGANCEGRGHPCEEFGHDLHQGDWENVEVVLNQTSLGLPLSQYKAQEYWLSQHKHTVHMSPSETITANKHVMVYAAHGTHAIYPMCVAEKSYPAFALKAPLNLFTVTIVRDHVCSQHNSRRPWVTPAETGRFVIGGDVLPPENLASFGAGGDREQFACWRGLFGYEVGKGPFEEGFGTSPRAPLRQLNHALEPGAQRCPEFGGG